MNKKMIQEVLKLTEECISRYWQLDIDFILSYCHEDVMWTGPCKVSLWREKRL